MYRYCQVKWYDNSGEECSEDFNSKLEAMAFMQYNDCGRKAHPKMSESEVSHSFDENGNMNLTERVI